MQNLILDGHSLACPSKSDYDDMTVFGSDFKKYLTDLVSWSDSGKYFKLVSNKDIEEVLHKAGAYPFWDSIGSALEFLDLKDDYSVKDVVRLVESLINKCERIEDIVEVSDVLCSTSEIVPAGALKGRHQEFISHFERIFGIIEIDAKYKNKLNNSSLVSSCVCSLDGRVGVVGEVVDYQIDSGERPLKLPHNFSKMSNVASCLSEMIKRVDYYEVWRRKSEESCCFAVEISILRADELDLLDIADLREKWSLGKDFLSSLFNLNFFGGYMIIEKVIRSLRETILRQSLNSIHALRQGEGGNAAAVMNGKYKAQRRDIDDEFHLHYWDDGKNITIANVVVHNDFSITKN